MTNERIHSDGAALRASDADARTELMHAVLDGTADADRIGELDALIASDASAAQEFAAWKTMFRTLSAIPMSHPPEGLVAAISAAIPEQAPINANKFSKSSQLFSGSPVIASGQAQTRRPPSGFRAFFRRPSRPESSQEFGQMNASRKIWAGGAIAAVALGVAVFATGYPPKAENLTGTVAPAERYRAPQAGGDAIKLGEPGATTTAATPTVAVGAEAAKADAQMKAEKADASRMVLSKTEAQLAAEKADASRMVLSNTDAQMKAEKTDAQMKAEKTDASRMVLSKTEAQLAAEKADASRMVLSNTDAQMKAQKTDAQMKAEKADASRMMLSKTEAQLAAEKADASRAAALKADAQLQAERARAGKTSN